MTDIHPRIAEARAKVEQDKQISDAVKAVFDQPDRPIMSVLYEELGIDDPRSKQST